VNDLESVVAALQAAPTVAVLAHVAPEGDAIGATLGACLALREAGKQTGAYNADPLPPGLGALPGVEHLVVGGSIPPTYGCYLVLDTSDLERTGGLLDGRAADAPVLNVDHHAGNTRFGTVNWIDPEASSAGEMVYRALRHGGFPITPPVATNLYAAILTDTGSFRYANTTPRALQAAADLVACGARPEEIARGLYRNRDPREWRLLSEVLAGLTLSPDGRLAWIQITRAALGRAGLGLEAAEDFIRYPRSLAGVQIALAFKEVSENEVRVSLRSDGDLDVARLAGQFGGGGHRNAAGCTLAGGLSAVRAGMLAAAAAYLAGSR
jgi:phosphoesterase RecJ-like protein